MLTLILGTDWKANSQEIMCRISQADAEEKKNQILSVPELISFETERKLCMSAGNRASRLRRFCHLLDLPAGLLNLSATVHPPA